jgi:aerobic carbon-monoxide dehydrogenase large subunit
VLPQGVIEVEIGTLSSGQGHETSYAQLLGEWLGVENERIRLVTGDSDRTKFGAGSHSGRSIRLASISMHAASQRIIEQGLQIASHLLEATAEDIDFTDGRFTIEGTDRAADLFTVAAAAEGDARVPEALRGPLVGTGDVVSRTRRSRMAGTLPRLRSIPRPGWLSLPAILRSMTSAARLAIPAT